MKLVRGFGINDAGYKTQWYEGNVRRRCQAYSAWCNMISRCYSIKELSRNKTYTGVSVCSEWRRFTLFRDWWLENHVDGWHLDKDILSDSRIYSPQSCLYVPQWLNKFISDGGSSRRSGFIGVSLHKKSGKFRAACSNPITGKSHYLGIYDDEASAHNEWLCAKLLMAGELRPAMDAIDVRIYQRVVEIISRM